MRPFAINGQLHLIDALRTDVPNCDLIAWLQSQEVYPKFYWKERDSLRAHAALGSLIEFSQIPRFENTPPFDIRFYGGMSFYRKIRLWKGFPDTAFWLPQIERIQEWNQTRQIDYAIGKKAQFSPSKVTSRIDTPCLSPLARQETPNFEQWEKNVQSALDRICSGELDKLVLARKTTLDFASAPSPWPILAHLKAKSLHTTLFAFQPSTDLCFFGASPEKLFQRENDYLIVDAVAGTRPIGKNQEEDLQLEKELCSSAKELWEFKVVKNYLMGALTPLTETLGWDGEDRILKNAYVQHLHNRIQAVLKPNVCNAKLVACLHPTPALGGAPRQEALALLKEIEPFDRGWYGAPIGIVEKNRMSLYAGIRSALVEGNKLHLFAGTGLVRGSTAACEWKELEQKVRPFTELL